MAKSSSTAKHNSSPLVQWLKNKENLSQTEILHFLQENKGRLEKSLASIHKRDLIYRFTNRFLAFTSFVAELIDKLKDILSSWLLKIPAPSILKNTFSTIVGLVNFKGVVEFVRAKFYAFKKAPHNTRVVQLMDDVMSHANQQGLDFKQHFPDIVDKFVFRKNQILQHSFFKEFTKSFLERLLAIPFLFNRSLSPVLADSALWHKFFVFLESRYIRDIVLVDQNESQTSFKQASKRAVESSQAVRTLYEASVIKAGGQRIFIIGHHEGYIGPYFVRSAIRQLGFDNLTANCNTVVGPRMFSNVVLKSGASNVGNLFLTLPSQKTTQVNEHGLAEALQKNARRTQFLIKMPNAGLKLIEHINYQDFMEGIINFDDERFTFLAEALDQNEKQTLINYLQENDAKTIMASFDKADYDLFKSVMYEPFLLFPEGSRSYNNKDGGITMKYFNPKFLQAYFRPGDVILPISLVGGSDITNGWRLKTGTLGLSVGSPISVTEDMIENYETHGVEIMKTIAGLSNAKQVRFCEKVQSGDTSELDVV